MDAPALNPLKVSLPQRAPTEPIAERIWRFWLDLGKARLDFSNALSQKAAAAPAAPAGSGQDEEAQAIPAAEYQPEGVAGQWETSESRETSWSLSINLCWFGVERKSVKTTQVTVRPVYVVLGIFKRGRVDLDSAGVADQLLADTYKQWHVSRAAALAWADWIHQTLNNNSQKVLEGTYSVEIVLGWSLNRISAVVLLPVLLSLAIGVLLNSKDWTDLATIQTVWGTASYIVTTGGWRLFLLALTILMKLSHDTSDGGVARYCEQSCG
ncbi:hypothetical protein N658DRAFT_525828 [Parathielavia hyrcaniae]|uniref:Uncharacterized protein n=1 Tax=Parathielavia hyrcaniae TaxID=113614 RepID=A0AAN6SZR5_9PEZI|nr:hypothetical protein N658DRAFT_525828 [Parathielavia hyrcaniae]